MPKKYEAIKKSLKKSGKSDKESKSIAAATYIKDSGKKGSKARSRAAKRLKDK